jgi:hypothetical protein
MPSADTMLRQARKDYTFSNGFSIPAGTRIAINQPALNRSEVRRCFRLHIMGRARQENSPHCPLGNLA